MSTDRAIIDDPQRVAPAPGDCWNVIGVRGDQSCPKLATNIHCRNCEVYADAAQRHLQRPVSAGYREQWADHFRQAQQASTPNDAAALVFRIGREWLALPTAMVELVAPQAKPHRLPHRRRRPRRRLARGAGGARAERPFPIQTLMRQRP